MFDFGWFGTTSAREALDEGFTHHGKFCQIPVWMNDGGMVTAKWNPLNLIIPYVAVIQVFLFRLRFPEEEPRFVFLKGPRIDGKKI